MVSNESIATAIIISFIFRRIRKCAILKITLCWCHDSVVKSTDCSLEDWGSILTPQWQLTSVCKPRADTFMLCNIMIIFWQINVTWSQRAELTTIWHTGLRAVETRTGNGKAGLRQDLSPFGLRNGRGKKSLLTVLLLLWFFRFLCWYLTEFFTDKN